MSLYNFVNKKITLGFLLIVGLVALFVYVLLSSDTKTAKEDGKESNNQPPLQIEEESQNIVGNDSLNTLLARRENLECNISYIQESDMSTVQGTYFTSNGRSRGDFILPEGIVSSMIVNNGVIHIWSELEGEKYGVRARVADLEAVGEGDGVEFKKPIPDDVDVKYNCKTWTAIDGSIFEPPTDILFTEFNSAINTGMEYSTIYEDPEAGIVLPELQDQ